MNKSCTTKILMATKTTYRTVFSSVQVMDGLSGKTFAALGAEMAEVDTVITARLW